MRHPVRRRKTSAAARIRPFWALIVLAAFLAFGALGFALAWQGFAPEHVVISGERRVSAASILSRAGIDAHESIWLQNPHAIAARVETIPYVLAAFVHRQPPSTISIRITEREPFARVWSAGRTALVDRTLRVLELGASSGTFPTFVLKTAVKLEPGTTLNVPQALALRDDYEAMIAAQVVPVRLRFDRFGGLVGTMRSGLVLLLGDDADLAKKLPLVDPILSQVVRGQRRVKAVDLRAPSTPVVVYR